MKILDLCCGAGLAADGYVAVGFDVTGVDLRDQPSYPYEFRRGDVLDVLASDLPAQFDAIHVSPPCQLFTRAKHLRDAQGGAARETVDLLTPTLALLRDRWGHKPWVVENVEGARPVMPDAVRLCGSMFHLGVQRHRLFSSNVALRGGPAHIAASPLTNGLASLDRGASITSPATRYRPGEGPRGTLTMPGRFSGRTGR